MGSPTPKSSSTPTCKDVINSCDLALHEKNTQIEETSQENLNLALTNKKTKEELDDTKGKLDKPFHNPLLMAAVGATVGMIVGGPIVIGVGFVLGLLFPIK